MDEMKLTSKLMRGVVARIIQRVIKNKFGCDVDVNLGAFYISYDDVKATIHLDAKAVMDKNNLEGILKDADLL